MSELNSSVKRWTGRLDAKVGERGLMISAGEKQRIVLARVFLKVNNHIFSFFILFYFILLFLIDLLIGVLLDL